MNTSITDLTSAMYGDLAISREPPRPSTLCSTTAAGRGYGPICRCARTGATRLAHPYRATRTGFSLGARRMPVTACRTGHSRLADPVERPHRRRVAVSGDRGGGCGPQSPCLGWVKLWG